MASSEEIEMLLENLRTPSDKKTIFEDSLEDAWSIFQFEGKPNLLAFEAFLIAAVSRCFEKADRDSNQAKSRDACLVGLGLLKECYHTNTKEGMSTHISVEERYISYLQGDYIELMRPHYKKGDNLDPSDRESKPRRALEKSDARARKRLASHLASQGVYKNDYQASLQVGIEKYTKSNESSEEEKRLEIILPEPCYTFKSFPSQSKPRLESGIETESDKEDPLLPEPSESPGEKPSKSIADRLKAWIKSHKVLIDVAIGVLVGALLTLIVISCRTSRQQQYQELREPELRELFDELSKMPPGSEIKRTNSTSYSDENGTYVIEDTVIMRNTGNPDS